MALVNCKECGTKISDKALACPKCGATQNDNSEKQGLNKSVENVFISSETKTFEIENQTSKTKEQIGETPTSKKTNSRIKWILLGIMMVILVGGSILLLSKDSDPSQELLEKARRYNNKGNYTEAVKYYKLAAEQGNAEAQGALGYKYHVGEGVTHNYKEAVKWYKLAAEQGYADAQYSLGLMYYKGHGVEQNYNEAMKWYKLAAEQGLAIAQNDLGTMYGEGEGVEQNYKEAIKWYKLAVKQGNPIAQCNLGIMYRDGKGVEQNYKEMVKWYKLSAEQGLLEAQYNLGVCYWNGEGVERNHDEAVKLFKLSAEQGHEYAIQALQSLSNTSTNNYNNSSISTRKQMEENLIGQILNTKWSFTSADGFEFILDIKGLGRDGESAKAELLWNGNVQEYITIKLYKTHTSNGYIPMGYEFDCNTSFKIYFSAIKYGWLAFAIWDYSNGYLYEDRDSFNSEAPDSRLSMKRIR